VQDRQEPVISTARALTEEEREVRRQEQVRRKQALLVDEMIIHSLAGPGRHRCVGLRPLGKLSHAARRIAPVPRAFSDRILRQRFARGEIDSDTFERMRHQLETSPVEQRPPATIS
jgi:Short C-terminal domain